MTLTRFKLLVTWVKSNFLLKNCAGFFVWIIFMESYQMLWKKYVQNCDDKTNQITKSNNCATVTINVDIFMLHIHFVTFLFVLNWFGPQIIKHEYVLYMCASVKVCVVPNNKLKLNHGYIRCCRLFWLHSKTTSIFFSPKAIGGCRHHFGNILHQWQQDSNLFKVGGS